MTDSPNSRVILLDIDGTVVNYRFEIPPSAREAIREARENGHRIYLCTGRAKAEVYPFIWELGIDGVILGNGAYVEDDGEVIHRQVMDTDTVKRAMEWLETEGYGFYLECNSGLFSSDNLRERALEAVRDTIPNMAEVWDDVMSAAIYDTSRGHDDVNKISFPLHKETDLDELARQFEGEAQISTWSASGEKPEFGEFGQLGIHKAVGIAALAEHLDEDPANMIAFGDADPDLEMLEFVGTGVAMGNGSERLKEAADLVTDHIDEDGLANAFRSLGLIS